MLKMTTQSNISKIQNTNIMEKKNLTLYEKFRSVPQTAQKPIEGGKLNGFTDINPMWRIKMLTEEFGECGFGWYYEEVERWKESAADETVCFMKIHLYIRRDQEWSRPIVGIGGSKLATLVRNRSQIDLNDEAYKMALTDAISIACKALGMGADIYYEKDRTKYDIASEGDELKKPSRKKAAQYTPVDDNLFDQMVKNFVHGVKAKSGEDYRSAWINYTHAGDAEIKMFDNAVSAYENSLQFNQ